MENVAAEGQEEEASLYERLGGEPAISAVVDDFVGRAANDPDVNFTRQGTGREWEPTDENVAILKKHLVQLLCQSAGGPQQYEGKELRLAHAGMQITDAEFDALVDNLVASLDAFNVPLREQDELLEIIESTRRDIVEAAAP
ncbi:MAG: group 1 truncated hemoglobin [Candidatus Omnitrophica bacterium]|nr:group 1 truncated hemoglobin [Candidatus Omnitrophota bacterium]